MEYIGTPIVNEQPELNEDKMYIGAVFSRNLAGS